MLEQKATGGAARLAGPTGLDALKVGAKFIGPLHLGVAAVGAAGNLGSRLMKGENIFTAAGNTVYDTADYAAFGLLKPAVGMIQGAGEMAGKAVFGQSQEQEINSAVKDLQDAEAAGDVGRATVAQQKVQQAMVKAKSGGTASSEADYSMGLQNQRFSNDLANQQRVNMQMMDNEERVKNFDFDQKKRAANIMLNNSYYADAYKNTQAMGLEALRSLGQVSQIGAQGVNQAFSMRY